MKKFFLILALLPYLAFSTNMEQTYEYGVNTYRIKNSSNLNFSLNNSLLDEAVNIIVKNARNLFNMYKTAISFTLEQDEQKFTMDGQEYKVSHKGITFFSSKISINSIKLQRLVASRKLSEEEIKDKLTEFFSNGGGVIIFDDLENEETWEEVILINN